MYAATWCCTCWIVMLILNRSLVTVTGQTETEESTTTQNVIATKSMESGVAGEQQISSSFHATSPSTTATSLSQRNSKESSTMADSTTSQGNEPASSTHETSPTNEIPSLSESGSSTEPSTEPEGTLVVETRSSLAESTTERFTQSTRSKQTVTAEEMPLYEVLNVSDGTDLIASSVNTNSRIMTSTGRPDADARPDASSSAVSDKTIADRSETAAEQTLAASDTGEIPETAELPSAVSVADPDQETEETPSIRKSETSMPPSVSQVASNETPATEEAQHPTEKFQTSAGNSVDGFVPSGDTSTTSTVEATEAIIEEPRKGAFYPTDHGVMLIPTVTTKDEADPPLSGSSAPGASDIDSSLAMILLVVMFVVVCVAAAVFGAYFRPSCSKYGGFRRVKSRESVMTETVVVRPPIAQSYSIAVDNLKAVDLDSLSSEFEELSRLAATSFRYPQTDAARPTNKDKNRYVNIHPFDYNRVVLPALPGDEHSDYINASYVTGFNRKNEFIAAQGPKPNTTVAFWLMIWQDNVSIVAMVTNLMEDNTSKCEKYWPDLNASQTYGSIQVYNKEEKLVDHFIVRRLEVVQNGVMRHIQHFQYIDWPDFGCPHDPQDLITFVRAVRSEIDGSCCLSPVVVHCSAGVGRTGTFIAVDWLLQQVQTFKYVDVFRVVCDLRRGRILMVQKAEQYKFIYKCLGHYVSTCWKRESLPARVRTSAMATKTSKRTTIAGSATQLMETSM